MMVRLQLVPCAAQVRKGIRKVSETRTHQLNPRKSSQCWAHGTGHITGSA